MDPGHVVDKAAEQARGVDVVGAGFVGALLDVGDLAFQRLVVDDVLAMGNLLTPRLCNILHNRRRFPILAP